MWNHWQFCVVVRICDFPVNRMFVVFRHAMFANIQKVNVLFVNRICDSVNCMFVVFRCNNCEYAEGKCFICESHLRFSNESYVCCVQTWSIWRSPFFVCELKACDCSESKSQSWDLLWGSVWPCFLESCGGCFESVAFLFLLICNVCLILCWGVLGGLTGNVLLWHSYNGICTFGSE